MFLKWTAKTFAAAAVLQLGLATAQESGDDSLLVPPAPNEFRGAEIDDAPAADEGVRDAQRAIREELREQRFEDRPQAVEREARYAPAGGAPGVDDHIRSATRDLAIDDETRSRYRWHNGEWWFKTRSGQWKFYRDGKWQEFDPTTYERPASAGNSAGSSYAPQASGGYAPQTYGSSSGYYENRPYGGNTQSYGSYGYDNNRYDGRAYGGSRNYDGRYDGRYYDSGLNNPGYGGYGAYGTGYRGGYNPANDRYYGRGPYGQPNSISGDRYRGGVIGSEIGGRIGGRTGAIIGGAIGADAAE